MLFSTFANCTSLREVAGSMLGLKGESFSVKAYSLQKNIERRQQKEKPFGKGF
jgi:hypothetical protein